MYTGGIFIDREVERMLKQRLHGTELDDPDIIRGMANVFETELKPEFDGVTDEYSLNLGVLKENYPSLRIHNGKMTLSDQDLRPAFDLVINQIITSYFKSLIERRAKNVILVGGLADSPYVRHVFWKKLAAKNIEIIPGGGFVNKAAAEGAIIGCIKQFVVARAAKATFGGCVRQKYEKKLHYQRRHAVHVYADGKQRVDGAFHMWIKKGTVLQGTFAYKLPYHLAWDATSMSESELIRKLGVVGIEVFAWEGDGIPTWCKDEQGGVLKGMRLICTLKADLSAIIGGLQINNGPRGTKFYRVDYNVCVYFGGTQLCAKLQWREKGVFRESQVTVMPYIS